MAKKTNEELKRMRMQLTVEQNKLSNMDAAAKKAAKDVREQHKIVDQLRKEFIEAHSEGMGE